MSGKRNTRPLLNTLNGNPIASRNEYQSPNYSYLFFLGTIEIHLIHRQEERKKQILIFQIRGGKQPKPLTFSPHSTVYRDTNVTVSSCQYCCRCVHKHICLLSFIQSSKFQVCKLVIIMTSKRGRHLPFTLPFSITSN